ncbi:hypothetical protein LptCag_1033 [Leptospirillum ferriphilum]|uniref:Uncharacterized protein n=1 Tax=Leptospirillum ferriphilum TaxID=178606 RepID=A0A094WCN8_9BACT|nr:hypothetical protein LptCag_1033 [Leptospirillum ferriphilum]
MARKVWGLAGLGNPVQSIRLPSGGEFPGIAVRRGEISWQMKETQYRERHVLIHYSFTV